MENGIKIAQLVLEFIKIIIWPATIFSIIIIFRRKIEQLLLRMKKAVFPGGISFEAFPEQIAEAKELSEEVKEEKLPEEPEKKAPAIPLTDANDRMLKLGLAPSSSGLEFDYYRNIAEQDPTLALAGLRIEVETMLKNLAKGFNVPIHERDSAGVIVRRLREKRAITERQAELISTVIRFCNSAIHGFLVSSAQAKEILDIATVLRDQYVAWLSWGFPEK